VFRRDLGMRSETRVYETNESVDTNPEPRLAAERFQPGERVHRTRGFSISTSASRKAEELAAAQEGIPGRVLTDVIR
jgi:hypothetical protein